MQRAILAVSAPYERIFFGNRWDSFLMPVLCINAKMPTKGYMVNWLIYKGKIYGSV